MKNIFKNLQAKRTTNHETARAFWDCGVDLLFINGAATLAAMKKINLAEIPWVERKSPKGRFHKFRRDVAGAFNSAKTGPKLPGQAPFEVELVRLPPKATNFPFHSHSAEWEFYLIISGTGKVRAGKLTRTIKAGDCILHPPGEAHQMVNTGRQDLLYYVIANNTPEDLWHYPDSGKWGVSTLLKIFQMKEVPYYTGEE